ncbi:hypothetical protein OF83DRAFT_1072926 [Amylostereum chailletii]|nr:hypothetical protein OF83DRAFT_1072926 [Amylostereum chailletii]
MQVEGFEAEDLEDFNYKVENKKLEDHLNSFPAADGWRETSIQIPLPCEGESWPSEGEAPHLEVDGIFYRPLLEVVVGLFQGENAKTFHMTPFKQFWQRSPDVEPERLYSEIYTSDAMLEADEEFHNIQLTPGDGPDVPRVVAAMMGSSDETQLANFGPASLWPGYIQSGNQTKYVRCRPTCHACQHVLYMKKLPTDFQDIYTREHGIPASAAVLTHCKRELFHAIWMLLLDEEFMHAYHHGVVVMCGNGIVRRIFPRFFTYSADYPEKVILASIKHLGACPCPRCIVPKDQIKDLGKTVDINRHERNTRVSTDIERRVVEKARKMIFEKGVPVNSARIDVVLGGKGLLPNVFATCLGPSGFNHYRMLTNDLLHEFELGVWKNTFIHLLRLLFAMGGTRVNELNKRFHNTPAFGRETIRPFTHNTSAMKQLAARNFEDILQVCTNSSSLDLGLLLTLQTFSVLSPCSRGFLFPTTSQTIMSTTKLSWISFSISAPGMGMRRCASTRKLQSPPFALSLNLSALPSDGFNPRRASIG